VTSATRSDVRPLRVLAISGSLRARASNTSLLRLAMKVAPDDMTIVMYDGLASLPHFNPDDDVGVPPAPVLALRAQVGEADGLLICSPEYAHGMPGSLKNALDWLVSALEPIGMPVLLVSASPSGAEHAHAQLLEVLRTMSMQVVDGGAHKFSRAKIGPNDEITAPELVAALTAGFAQLAEVSAARTPIE